MGETPRIALLTPMLPVAHDPTRGRYIYETARSLARLTPTRVYFQQQRYPAIPGLRARGHAPDPAGRGYSMEGITVEAFAYPALPVVSRPLNGWLSSRQLLPRLRAFAPDVLLAYWVVPDGQAAVLAGRALGIPVVVGALGSDIYVRDRLNHWLTRRTLRAADAVLAVAEQMRGVIIARYGTRPERVHTIVNGYDAAVFHPRPRDVLRRQLGLPAEARVILYAGRLVPTKGLAELMQVFNGMARTDARLHLAIVGQGAMQRELVAAAAASGTADRVQMPGGLVPTQVAEWIGAADLLCLPSWSEGYPNVVVEAIACGCPVVATDVGGTSEIVKATNGLLVPPREPARLQAALAAGLERRWDRAAIAAAIRRSWDDVARETLEVCAAVATAR